MNTFELEKQEYPLLIEGTLRHQNNIKTSNTKYGNTFICKIINTNYFGDDKIIPTLVVSDDISLVLGKPRYPDNFTDDEYKIKLIDRNNSGLYSIEVSKCDNDNDARENIRQKLFQQIESEIDEKVYKWMEPKQTKFKYYEKDKIEQFNMELIQFLNCLRDTSKFPTTFREQSEFSIIGEKIHHILKTMKSFIH
jgi:hypothetical protein